MARLPLRPRPRLWGFVCLAALVAACSEPPLWRVSELDWEPVKIWAGPGGRVVAVAGNALSVTEDRGASWRHLRMPLPRLRGVWGSGDGLVIAYDMLDGIARSTDHGRTWTVQELRPTEGLYWLDAISGRAPREAYLPGAHLRPYDGTPSSGGADSILLHSTDGGEHWSPESLPFVSTIFAASATPASGLYLTGIRPRSDERLLAHTRDGRSWSVVPLTGGPGLVADDEELYVLGGRGIDRSRDGGHTFVPAIGGYFRAFALGSEALVAVGAKGRVVRIDRQTGETVEMGPGPENYFSEVAIAPEGDVYAVATYFDAVLRENRARLFVYPPQPRAR